MVSPSTHETRLSRSLDVVHHQRVLIANVQAAVTDDRVRPAQLSLLGNRESSLLPVARRCGLGESDRLFSPWMYRCPSA